MTGIYAHESDVQREQRLRRFEARAKDEAALNGGGLQQGFTGVAGQIKQMTVLEEFVHSSQQRTQAMLHLAKRIIDMERRAFGHVDGPEVEQPETDPQPIAPTPLAKIADTMRQFDHSMQAAVRSLQRLEQLV